MEKQSFVDAGKIVNTHGVRGEVRIEVWLDSPALLKRCGRVFLGGEEKKLLSAREHKGFLIAQLEGVADVNAAQALKGLGMMFSGAVAQAKKEAVEQEAKKAAAELAIFDNWEENLPAFPKWDVGGEDFELREDMPRNGKPFYIFSLTGRPYLTELYAAKLRNAGFQAMGSNPLDLNADRLYKIIDDVCWVWDRSEGCYEGGITMAFYADQYRPAPKKESSAQSPTDLKGLAKGIFKKLF
jgi:hypothetical protein